MLLSIQLLRGGILYLLPTALLHKIHYAETITRTLVGFALSFFSGSFILVL